MWKLALVPLMLMALILGACGDDDDDDGDDQVSAEQNLCASLSGFSASLSALEDLDASTASQDDYDAAVEDVQSSWDQVQEDAADVSEADVAALESAYGDLDQAIEDAPDDEPIADALATLSEEITAVKAAYEEINNGLSC